MRTTQRFTTFLAGCIAVATISLLPAKAAAVEIDVTAVSEAAGCAIVAFSGAAQNGVNYVGVPTSTSNAAQNAQAQRFLTLATAVLLSGKHFRVGVSDTLCGTNTNVKVVTFYEIHP